MARLFKRAVSERAPGLLLSAELPCHRIDHIHDAWPKFDADSHLQSDSVTGQRNSTHHSLNKQTHFEGQKNSCIMCANVHLGHQ